MISKFAKRYLPVFTLVSNLPDTPLVKHVEWLKFLLNCLHITTRQRFCAWPGNEKCKNARLRFLCSYFGSLQRHSRVAYCLLDFWAIGQVMFLQLTFLKCKENVQYPCKRRAFGDISFKLNFSKWRRINFLSSHFNNLTKVSYFSSPFK